MPSSLFPFRCSPDGFTYLGVYITNNIRDLFSKNFPPLLEKCKADFLRWSNLPLSMAGRINLIKMTILPKFLYLFTHLPVYIKKSFFNSLESLISSFIWNNKSPRLSRAILQSPKSEGGFNLPNLRYYYWACNTQKILYWLDDYGDRPAWVGMELASSKCSLHSMVCARFPLDIVAASSNLIVRYSLRIWVQIRKELGLLGLSMNAPIRDNHMFLPSQTDCAFGIWAKAGLYRLEDLYTQNLFKSFQDLKTEFNLQPSQFFRYLQVRSFIQKHTSLFPSRPPDSLVDSILSIRHDVKHLISIISSLLRENIPTPQAAITAKSKWEGELGVELSAEYWQAILAAIHSSSICVRHSLIQAKVVFRAHYTRLRLSKIYNITDMCIRCGNSPADHLHTFVLCPSLAGFWAGRFEMINGAYRTGYPMDPCIALFGVSVRPLTPSHINGVFAFSTLLARRLILLQWKSKEPPTLKRWTAEVLTHVKLEKLRYSLRGSLEKFNLMWLPLLEFFSSQTHLP